MLFSLSLAPLLDSAFPTGAFSHSFGLETALQENRVKDSSGLSRWLASYIKETLAPMEGGAVYWAHHLVGRMRKAEQAGDGIRKEMLRESMNQEMILQEKAVQETMPQEAMLQEAMAQDAKAQEDIAERLKDLDRRLTVSRLARESREGGIKIGRRYLRIIAELYPQSGMDEYERWIEEGTCFGHPCIVHGWICAYLEQTAEAAVLSYLYVGTNNMIQNALRAMAIGQTAGQKVLHQLLPLLEKEAESLVQRPPALERLASGAPVQEIQEMRHERLYSRLFMS